MSLDCNAHIHPFLLRFEALLQGSFLDDRLFRCYVPLDAHHAFKRGSLYDPYEFGEKKKIARSKIEWIRRLFQYGDAVLGQEMLRALWACAMFWWCCHDLPWQSFVSSRVLRKVWQELTSDDAPHIEEWMSPVTYHTYVGLPYIVNLPWV